MSDLFHRSGKSLISLVVLIAIGLATQPLAGPAWEEVKSGQPELRVEELEAAIGHGLILGILGGFRSALADIVWLRMTYYWSARNWPKVEAAVHLATSLDPRSEFFWVSGARMIAYDIPAWRISERERSAAGSWGHRPIREEQALRAIRLLERAALYHPQEPRIWIEIAQVHLNQRENVDVAAQYFLRAAAIPGAPFFAGRLYAELTRRSGRPEETYRFYCRWHPTLPADDPAAVPDLILERIRILEEELGVPWNERYVPPDSTPRLPPEPPPGQAGEKGIH